MMPEVDRRSRAGGVFSAAAAWAHDETNYPDWSGQWLRTGGIQSDPTRPIGRGQQAPLTPEYQAIFEASLADQAVGGASNDARYSCFPVGMPRLSFFRWNSSSCRG